MCFSFSDTLSSAQSADAMLLLNESQANLTWFDNDTTSGSDHNDDHASDHMWYYCSPGNFFCKKSFHVVVLNFHL